MQKNPELSLQGLFIYLTQRGFKLSVRDYMDAVKSLQKGYGTCSRDGLLWLCKTLWARTDEEIRFLELLIRELPYPSEEEIKKLVPQFPGLGDPDIDKSSVKPHTPATNLTADRAEAAIPGLEFTSPTHTGLGLPEAQVHPTWTEPFILTPKPTIPMRNLIIAWRRFRTPTRTGPKVELDIDATIEEQCRMGFLLRPALIPDRVNQAKLIVLIDVSRSMVPWSVFNQTLLNSLKYSQLGQVDVFFFDNVPEGILYRQSSLRKPVPLDELLKSNTSSTLLVLSDAGAARGYHNRERIAATLDFANRVSNSWQPVAWVNPMPASRWKGTTAEAISAINSIKMFELNEDEVIRVVDLLRGKRME